MMKNLGLPAAIIAILASSRPSISQDAFLPIEQVVTTLADGRPWTVNAPDGKKLSFTFNADHTASIRGPLPVPLSITWFVGGDELCLATPKGAKCLRFQQVPGGLQGWDDDKKDMKLVR
ncbi:MAG: hypothetical protein EOR16_15885 [Mesorhizobium sp.]|uniref:hypothetical protein n=1 Tax=Mesorhizobium sp. TaxID=1871066 RepID=UPI000FE50D35|nr:hypothetical protein [Mesorhizobium sp.]RWI57072.1 MAG: hypothetical protein EOR16_15885 [Mesorhizobium sp.]